MAGQLLWNHPDPRLRTLDLGPTKPNLWNQFPRTGGKTKAMKIAMGLSICQQVWNEQQQFHTAIQEAMEQVNHGSQPGCARDHWSCMLEGPAGSGHRARARRT